MNLLFSTHDIYIYASVKVTSLEVCLAGQSKNCHNPSFKKNISFTFTKFVIEIVI